MAGWAVISVALVMLVDSYILVPFGPQVVGGGGGFRFPLIVLIAELVVGYLGAWWLTFATVRDAPTRELARRALWLTAAVGIAVVPRIGLVPQFDLPLSVPSIAPGLAGAPVLALVFLDVAESLAVSLLVYGAGAHSLRRQAPRDLRPEADRRLRFVLAVVMALALLFFALGSSAHLGGPEIPQGIFYGTRWLVFAAMLVHGILLYEIVDFPRARDRAVPAYGAMLAALATFLIVDSLAVAFGESEAIGAGLGIAVGLGVAVPAGLLTRGLVQRFEAGPAAGAERRLELYRAAVEAAWARGAPTAEARAQLESDRRAFGVSREEAQTLEHVVTVDAAGRGRRLASGEEAAPGLVLGRLLGEGAHGRVFAAVRYPGGERVVVKEMRSDQLGRAEVRRRLLDEVRALRALHHPNIVGLLDAEVRGGASFLVMQFVEARTLEARLRDGALPEQELRQVLADLLAALKAAHKAGIVHRDVKPSNVLLGKDGRAYLTDFGIASLQPRRGGMTAANVTALEGMAGTPAYMAPEQVLGGKVGPSTDLYAVGLVAFEALTGRPAHDLAHRSAFEALERVAHPRFAFETAPAAWRPWLGRALSLDATGRFTTPAEMQRSMPPAASPSQTPR